MSFNIDLSIADLLVDPRTGWSIAILLAIWVIRDFVKNIPAFLRIKAIVYVPIARVVKFKLLEKEAIRSDVQGNINYIAQGIAAELPENSLKPMELYYEDRADPESFIRNGKIFVRIRPVEDEDNNFLNVAFLYLELALLPSAKPLLSTGQIKAVTYFTTHRLLQGRKTLIEKLHDDYYKPDTEKLPALPKYFQGIQRLDGRGLFYSVMLRVLEIESATLRFKTKSLNQEFDKVFDHLLKFLDNLKSREKNEEVWFYVAEGITFSLLLVAKPQKTIFVEPDSYVRRLKKNLTKTDWVFVIFSEAEKQYGNRVASLIEKSGLVDLVGTVECLKDYRGKNGGIVKVYAKRERVKKY